MCASGVLGRRRCISADTDMRFECRPTALVIRLLGLGLGLAYLQVRVRVRVRVSLSTGHMDTGMKEERHWAYFIYGFVVFQQMVKDH